MKRVCIILCLFLLSISQAFAGILNPGQGLTSGQRIYSENGQYYAQMQTDGNFVVYTNSGTALWSTGTPGSGADWAVMQSDGNFVLYNREQNKAIWASNTAYKRSGFAAITDYGQWIVVTNIPIWASNTSDNNPSPPGNPVHFGQEAFLTQGTVYTAGQYQLVFQWDGNLVIYSPSGAIWSTNTENKGAGYAQFTSSMLIVDKSGHVITTMSPPLWDAASGILPSTYPTTEWNSTYLAMQQDGNLVIYLPHRGFASYSPYAPTVIYASNPSSACYGPPDACMGQTTTIYNYGF